MAPGSRSPHRRAGASCHWSVDVSLREDLRHALTEENLRKIDKWTARYRLVEVSWSAALLDPFFNANTPEDIELAEKLIGDEDDD